MVIEIQHFESSLTEELDEYLETELLKQFECICHSQKGIFSKSLSKLSRST